MHVLEEINMKKLVRSKTDRKLLGVCGGIAEYFRVDPAFIRLGFVLFAVLVGNGFLAYVIAALIMP